VTLGQTFWRGKRVKLNFEGSWPRLELSCCFEHACSMRSWKLCVFRKILPFGWDACNAVFRQQPSLANVSFLAIWGSRVLKTVYQLKHENRNVQYLFLCHLEDVNVHKSTFSLSFRNAEQVHHIFALMPVYQLWNLKFSCKLSSW